MLLTTARVGWKLCFTRCLATAALLGGMATGTARSQSPEAWRHDAQGPVAAQAPEGVFVPTSELDAIYERLQAAEARLMELDALQAVDYDVLEANDLAEPAGLEDRIESIESKLKKDADAAKKKKAEDAKKPKKWFDNVSIRGYAQFRYNYVTTVDDISAAPQHVGDSSIGINQEFLIRRARVIFTCQPNEHVRLYLQPDFASTPDAQVNNIYFAQIRDWYADLNVDKKAVHRFRVGQSKVPYGWENLQSSQNRLYLDRNDAFNSAVRNERDLGVFYYWTPVWATDLFKRLVDDGLKGSGNYGLFGAGVYNGQGGSLRELNDELHTVVRFTYPWCLSNGQIMEAGIQGYTGRYVVTGSAIQRPDGVDATPAGTGNAAGAQGHTDKRIGATYVIYPQPWGFQTEWTVGKGPALNEAYTAIEDRSLYGGYVMGCYKWDTACHGTIFPFVRYQEFTGGYKNQNNAPYSHIREWNIGTEWQFNKWAELVTEYCITDRTNTTASTAFTPYSQFDGQVLRFQVQAGF